MHHWVPHEEQVWLPGTRVNQGSYKTDLGVVSVSENVEKDLEPISDQWAFEGVSDVCLLSNVSDAALLHTLRVRYGRDDIYTYISCILISVNPFKPISNYSSEYIQLYHSAQDKLALPPHIFGLSSEAFMRLVDGQRSQAMLISGESGAGKTENTKFVLLFLSEILRSQAGLADRLIEVNPILESFGNAKTVRNNNSSRFGKWIEVLVNPATMSLAGATVTDYLLEVTRVCSQGPDERNYHIFYQLLTPAAKEAYPMLKIGDVKDYAYVNRNPAHATGVDDTQDFQELRDALAAMKFTSEEEEDVMRIAAGILHLGNLDFEGASDGQSSKAKDESVFATVAEVLKFSPEGLSEVVRYKRITTGKETVQSPLDPEKASQQRDSIAKMIYSRLFKMLVGRCNGVLGTELNLQAGTPRRQLFFGVLDIAGFETFETNMLEQLFINLSNEKLQQFFNHSVFKTELKEYEDEGIPISKINYQDNADVLALIEGKGGLLLMLDDATMGVRQTDLQYTTKVIQQHEKNAKFFKPKFVKDAPLSFGIKHYAGDVMYTTDGFLVKNVSTQPPEVLELMASSELSIMKELAQDPEVPEGATRTAKKATVSAAFRKSLQMLIEKLSESEAHFTRCIKPNKEKVADKFDGALIMDQLRLSGVMETVKIRKSGFLMRPPCMEFLQRFLLLLPKADKKVLLNAAGSKKDSHPSTETDVRKACGDLIETLAGLLEGFNKDEIALGKTKVFVKSDLYRVLEDARRQAFVAPTITIQAVWRGHRTRVLMKEVLEVNAGLKKFSAEAGVATQVGVVPLKSNIKRATVVANSLTQMDLLLDRAVALPIRLPSLPLYIKARASLAAQATLARQLQDCQTSPDLPKIQALVARAASHMMQGELIEELKQRCETLEKHLHVRRALKHCVFSDVLEDVRKVLEEARSMGLDSAEVWLLTDGPDAWANAGKRMEQLEIEQREKAKAIAGLETQIRHLAATVDLHAMQSLLFQSMAYNMRGELVQALDDFATAASRFKEFKDGTEAEAKKPDMPVEEMESKLQELQSSLDLPAIQAILHSSQNCPDVRVDLVKSLQARCSKLERQTLLRRELQSCAVAEQYDAVHKVLMSAFELGLDKPEAWLLADGPTLVTRAKALREELQSIDMLNIRISKAAGNFDAQTLQSCFAEASALGVPLSHFAEAHEIFLNLQSGHFVESTSAQLRETGGSEPSTLLKISNLAEQLEVLGMKVDSAGMQDVAYEMSAEKRNAKKKKTRKSVFDSDNQTAKTVAQKVFEDLTNFGRLRDPLNWGMNGLAVADADEPEADPAIQRQAMLQYSPERIREALTELPPELEQIAVSTFLDLLRCMGDKPSTFKGDKHEPLIHAAKKHKLLADEVFVQVMKQLTENPSTRSLASGWELLKVLVQEVTPSHELGEFLRAFLQRKAEDREDALTPPPKRSRGESLCGEAEVRTRDRSETWAAFNSSQEPKLAGETLKIFLQKVIANM